MKNLDLMLKRHAVLNVYNISRLRIFSILLSPFAHFHFFSLLRAAFMTASVIDVMIDDKIHDIWILFIIYAGSWVYWISGIHFVLPKLCIRSPPT